MGSDRKRKPKKPKLDKEHVDDKAKAILEETFSVLPYINPEETAELSARTGLNERTIKSWFTQKKKIFEKLRRQRKSMSVPCDLCQKVVTKGYLTTHLKVTHGDGWSGRTQYGEAACNQCDKTFSSKQSLRQHISRHTA